MNLSSTIRRSPTAGFTLVEVLAVLAILGLLMSLGVYAAGRHRMQARVAETRAIMAELETLITGFEVKHGDFPPDRLAALSIKKDNDWNEAIEACVAALHGKAHPTGSFLSDGALSNTDQDETSTPFHRAGSPFLLESADSWGQPFAYFHHRSYGESTVVRFSASDPLGDRFVDARTSEVTGIHANPDTYQLISAGPDEEFGTDDDICNF